MIWQPIVFVILKSCVDTYAMAPNVAGVIGSAVAAGVLLSLVK
ncbi:hypothetical protein [Methyloglobulus sp.]